MTVKPITGFKVNGETQPVSYPHLHGKTAVEFTPQTLTDEQKSQARENIDVPSLDTLTSVETQLNGSISANKKQIENLKKLAQGKIYDFEMDTSEVYIKSVPTGAAPYAAIKAIDGKSIVWNQLVNIKTTELSVTFNGITFTRTVGSYVMNASGTCEKGFWLSQVPGVSFHIPKSVIKEHKYLCWAKGAIGYNNDVGFTETGASASVNGATIKHPLNTRNSDHFQMAFNKDTTYNISFIPQVYDLTLMFGAGNEPATVEEFEEMFPAEYYEYNEGEIVSAEVQNVKSVGKARVLNQLFNFDYKFSTQSVTLTKASGRLIFTLTRDDSYPSAGVYFYPKSLSTFADSCFNKGNKILSKVVVKSSIDCKVKFGADSTTALPITGDGNPSQLKHISTLSGTAAVLYVSHDAGNAGKTIEFTNVQLFDLTLMFGAGNEPSTVEEFEAIFPDEYYPFDAGTLNVKDNFPIPEAVKQLEGYGCSAGTAKNWVDFEKKVYHREVVEVDLGTFNYFKQNYVVESGTANAYFQCNAFSLNGSSAKDTTQSKEVVNTKGYDSIGTWWQSNTFVDKKISVASNTVLRITDTEYADSTAEEFKAAMQGVIAHFALATPEEIDISDILTDDNLIEVEAGGTLTFEDTRGDSYRLPVPSGVEYMINLQEAVA